MQQFDRSSPGVGLNVTEWEAFVQKHGSPVVQVESGTWLFPDGAAAMATPLQSGFFDPPVPEDGFACLNLRRRYCQTLLDRFVTSFNELKKDALNGGIFTINWPAQYAGPQPGGGIEPCLLRLKHLAAKTRKRLTAIRTKILDTPEGKKEAHRIETEKQRQLAPAEAQRKHAAAAIEFTNKIQSMSID